MLIEITEFFFRLDEIHCWVDSSGISKFPFQCTPSEFLDFANRDLKKGDVHDAANALANAKRALDCQLDYFLRTYGLYAVSEKQRWSTSRKISLMDELGVVPERILHKINLARNDLEHRYELPSISTAENSIDVVDLFIAATDLYLFPARFGTYFEIEEKTKQPDKNAQPLKLSDLLKKPPLAEISLQLLENDGIDARGKINGIALDYQISSEDNLHDYLYLLTFILHSHRINTPNSTNFFLKVKYAKPPQ